MNGAARQAFLGDGDPVDRAVELPVRCRCAPAVVNGRRRSYAGPGTGFTVVFAGCRAEAKRGGTLGSLLASRG